MTKFAADRPFAEPESSPHCSTNSVEAVQDGRIYIEKINGAFLFRDKATPAEYKAGLDLAIAGGWLVLNESGTFVPGADLFA